MSTTVKVTAWICIASILFTGCYTTTLIDLRGKEGQGASSADIASVVMNSGVQYHFAAPPVVLSEAILLKRATGGTDTLRANDISYVITTGGSKQSLDAVVTADKVFSAPIEYVILKDGTAYIFEGPAAIDRNHVNGVLKATAAPGLADDPTAWNRAAEGTLVVLPLSDVAQVGMSEFDPGLAVGIAGGLLLMSVLVYAVSTVRLFGDNRR